MNRFYTTVEESKHLLELGLSAESADMEWIGEHWCDEETGKIVDGWSPIPVCKIEIEEDDGLTPITLPCWSLQALLEALPQGIKVWVEREHCRKTYELGLFRSYYHCCFYTFGPSLSEENHDQLLGYGGDTWIEAVYNVALELAEKGWLTCKRVNGKFVIV